MPEVYRRNAAIFKGIVGSLDEAQLSRPVPACPAWDVHDLLAHQAGSSTDLSRGNVSGVATPAWTARQVEDRRGRAVAELVAEWSANVDAVAALCDSSAPNPAWDVTAHLDDLREAVGLARVPPDEGWGAVLVAAVGLLGERGPTVSIAQCEPDPGDTTWHVATAYGLWRALFSRLDRPALEREVLRGDVDGFARAAFFAA